MGKGASAKQEVTEYRMSMHVGIGWEVDGIKRILFDDKVAWSGDETTVTPIAINQTELFGGVKKEGGVAGIAYFLPGRSNQVMPNVLAQRFGLTSATCPAFRGVSTIFFVGSAQSNESTSEFLGIDLTVAGAQYQGGFYFTANSPFIRPLAITSYRAPKGLDADIAMIGDDANPIHIVYECLTNTDWGMGAPTTHFNTALWQDVAQVIFDEGFGLSLKWSSQMMIEEFCAEIIDHIQATIYVNPRTGLLEIKLLRDDYDLETVRELNPGNARFTKFSRKMWGETANEIVVTWTNPENEQEETVTAHDLGNIAAQGNTISDSRNYYAIRNAVLAQKVADRDVRMSATPLSAVECEVDRTAWDVLPGEVRRVTWPEKNIDNIVMRVMTVDYGKKGDSPIKITLLEDVFSLTRPISHTPPSSGWNGSAEEPAAIEFAAVHTLPAYLATQQSTSAGDLAYPEVIAGLLTYQPGNDTIAYNLYSQSVLNNGDVAWRDGGIKTVLGRSTMLTPIYQEAVSVVAGLPLLAKNRGPQVGGFVVFGDGSDAGSEYALLRSIDPDDNTWTVDRGVLDTVPRSWPADTPVWFIPRQSAIADDDQVRSAGETVDYKLLTRTSLGQLAFDDAPTVSGTMTARPHLPLRPANVKVNGTGYGEVDATSATELAVTWSNRNRLTEDGQVVKWTAGDVAGEYLQETLITVYREDGTDFFQVRGLWSDTDYTIPLEWVEEETRIFIRLSSERKGLASLQNYGLWVDNLPAVAVPSPPPDSPVIVHTPPSPPDPDPDPTPDPLPAADDPPAIDPGGGGGPHWDEVIE